MKSNLRLFDFEKIPRLILTLTPRFIGFLARVML